jgi:primosomal protein N' (replication factor Y)
MIHPLFIDVVILLETKALAEKRYTYSVPDSLSNCIGVGSLVAVSFGNQAWVPAVVLSLQPTPSTNPQNAPPHLGQPIVKPILTLLSPTPLLTPEQLQLWQQIATYTCTPLAQVILTALPSSFLKPNSQFVPKTITVVQFHPEAIPSQKLSARLNELNQALQALYAQTQVAAWSLPFVVQALKTTTPTLKKLALTGVLTLVQQEIFRSPLNQYDGTLLEHPLVLNEAQQVVVDAVLTHPAKQSTPFLLHGITGAGKTEVYMALAEETLAQGKSVLLLVPEIALTGALAQRMLKRFGREQIALWHSQLSHGEKLDAWLQLKQGNLRFLIGARSGIFPPIPNLGLIILDECHDASFKQESPAPRYDARTVAQWLQKITKATLVFGSATPEIAMYHQALAENPAFQLLSLTQRFGDAKLPSVHIVDMKREKDQGNNSVLSRAFKQALLTCIEQGEQAIILLNRRGFNTYVHCQQCAYVFECPSCSVGMTFHAHEKKLKCHHCGYHQPVTAYCPKCASLDVKLMGTGTQRLEAELQALLPEGKAVLRLDGDIMAKKGAFHEVLSAFSDGEASVLVGTQMVAKGLDVANVTLVGVLGADSTFHSPEYKAFERGFQLLTQVAGRAGRGEKAGTVYFQVFEPEHPVLRFAQQQNFEAFFAYDIAIRKQEGYPPFSQLIRLLVSGEDLDRVIWFAEALLHKLKTTVEQNGLVEGVRFLGPAPCLVERLKDKFRYHILIKNWAGEAGLALLQTELASVDTPKGLLLLIDVDCQSLL